MEKAIKIKIAGKDYSLVGENEEAIINAAELVDQQIKELKKKHEDEPSATISVLAALNIAEKHYKNRHQNEIDTKYIFQEISKMTEFIKSKLND